MTTLMHQFEEDVRAGTGLPVSWPDMEALRLPQFLAAQFRVHRLSVGREEMFVIEAVTDDLPTPTKLQRQVGRVVEAAGTTPERACLVASRLAPYTRRRLIELHQPFCIPGQQLYWPALGAIQIRQRPKRSQAPVRRDALSPSGQQTLLALLLKRVPQPWRVSTLAEHLSYSAMTASRAVSELMAFGVLQAQDRGRERNLALSAPARDLWERMVSELRNPVMRVIRVREQDLPDEVRLLAGESALAGYTALMEPQVPAYACTHRLWKTVAGDIETMPQDDEGLCRIELWRYDPKPLGNDRTVDPLSLALSLRENKDERVEQAVEAMLEAMPW